MFETSLLVSAAQIILNPQSLNLLMTRIFSRMEEMYNSCERLTFLFFSRNTEYAFSIIPIPWACIHLVDVLPQMVFCYVEPPHIVIYVMTTTHWYFWNGSYHIICYLIYTRWDIDFFIKLKFDRRFRILVTLRVVSCVGPRYIYRAYFDT